MDEVKLKKRTFKKTMTDKALEANRQNAQKSTGPKSKRDIQNLQPNTKHGILASIPVLPMIENQEEWDQFVVELKLNLHPSGALEVALVERIAGILWKQRRLQRYEQNRIAKMIEEAKFRACQKWEPSKDNPYIYDNADYDKIEKDVHVYPKVVKTLEKIVDGIQLKRIDYEVGKTIVRISSQIWIDHLNREEEKKVSEKQNKYGLNETYLNQGFTEQEKLIIVLKDNAKKCGVKDWIDHCCDVLSKAYDHRDKVVKDFETLNKRIEFEKIDSLEAKDDNLMKAETHLNRLLMQTLHELQRVQGMRAGLSGPPEAIDITGTDI